MLKIAKSQVRVKICGITRLEDAQAAVRFGADAIGFVFADSPRQISPKKAREISRKIGPFVTRVGVFVNEPVKRVLSVMDAAMLDVVQLHGLESPEMCGDLAPYRVIKVFRIGPHFSTKDMNCYAVEAFMFESDTRLAGGSGQTWDWKRLARTPFAAPIIVTGGLNPANVQRAIRTLKPYAVDVSSGVEKQPGVKDHHLMETFIRNAKAV